jgi:hypothetical protein
VILGSPLLRIQDYLLLGSLAQLRPACDLLQRSEATDANLLGIDLADFDAG